MARNPVVYLCSWPGCKRRRPCAGTGGYCRKHFEEHMRLSAETDARRRAIEERAFNEGDMVIAGGYCTKCANARLVRIEGSPGAWKCENYDRNRCSFQVKGRPWK